MAAQISYKRVIRDYFADFVSGFCKERLGLPVCCMAVACPFAGVLAGFCKERLNWLIGIPVFFALLSSAFHTVSLPFMMYLIPYSRQERETYIQKMLVVKVGIPIAFACLCDIVALFTGSVTFYALILQIISIFVVTFISGMLSDGRAGDMTERRAYGGMRYYVFLLVLLCYFEGSGILALCMVPISGTVFWIVIGILTVTLLPGMAVAGMHWKNIRSSFADYELAVETEVKVCR